MTTAFDMYYRVPEPTVQDDEVEIEELSDRRFKVSCLQLYCKFEDYYDTQEEAIAAAQAHEENLI